MGLVLGVVLLSGVVVDPAGAPIDKAAVVLAPEDHTQAARTAYTGRDGSFRFEADGPGRYALCLSAQGFEKKCLHDVDGGNSGKVVLVPGPVISPIVVDQGISRGDPVSANTGRGFVQGTNGADAHKTAPAPQGPRATTKDDLLRGAYGPYRANNDLLSYHLDVRVNPDKKTIAGKNTVRFRMLEDGRRIQLDLVQALAVDRIVAVDEAGRAVEIHAGGAGCIYQLSEEAEEGARVCHRLFLLGSTGGGWAFWGDDLQARCRWEGLDQYGLRGGRGERLVAE